MTQKLRVYGDFYMRIRVNIPKPASEGSQMPVSAAPAPRDLMHLLVPANIIQKGSRGNQVESSSYSKCCQAQS